jgi:hypothetical protein
MTTKEELEQLKKNILILEAKIANEEKQEIKTCEDAFNKLKPEWWFSPDGDVTTGDFTAYRYEHNQCNMTSEKEAKRIKALIELRRNAEAMNEGVKLPTRIYYIQNDFQIGYSVSDSSLQKIFPIFHTKELAMQALTNFKPLFEDLYAS